MAAFADRTYIDLSVASKPGWALGCDKCRYGLVNPPPVTVADTSTYLVRTYQAANDRLTFCDCQAGQAYRHYLRGRYTDIKAGRDNVPPDMSQALTEAVTMPTLNGEYVR